MDAFLSALQARDGVARTQELLRAGVTKYALAEAVAAGRVLRPSRGVIALPDADPLVVRCVATNSLLTCASAARQHGLWLLHEPDRIHVVRPDGRYRSNRAVVHRRTWVPPEHGSRLASLADVVLHAAQCLPELEALVLVESAVQKGLSLDFLRAQLAGPRNGRARQVLDLVDKGSESPIETLAREHLRRAGLRVEPQVYVAGVGWMDTVVERCVDVELDGQTHEEPESRRSDYARDAAAQALGFATLRFGYADVVYRPDTVVSRVKDVVATRLSLGRLPVY